MKVECCTEWEIDLLGCSQAAPLPISYRHSWVLRKGLPDLGLAVWPGKILQ